MKDIARGNNFSNRNADIACRCSFSDPYSFSANPFFRWTWPTRRFRTTSGCVITDFPSGTLCSIPAFPITPIPRHTCSIRCICSALLFPDLWGFNFFIVSHFWLAAFGFYALSRQFDLSAPAALFSAIAFTYGGFFISLGHLPIVLNSTTYVPWVLLAFKKLTDASARKEKVVWNGHDRHRRGPAMARGRTPDCGHDIRNGGDVCPDQRLPSNGRRFTLPLRCLLGQFFFWPRSNCCLFSRISLSFSNRSQALGFAVATKWSMAPETLWSLILPHGFSGAVARPFGWGYGFWEVQGPYIFSIHMGIISLVLGAAAWRHPSRIHGVLLLLCLLGIGMSLGRHSGLYRLVFDLPLLSQFRFPEKYFSPLAMCPFASWRPWGSMVSPMATRLQKRCGSPRPA